MRASLRTWLSLSHVAVFLLPLVVMWGSRTLTVDLRAQTLWDLEHQGALLEIVAQDLLWAARRVDPDAGVAEVADALSERLRRAKSATLSGIRVTDATGIVVSTSGTELGADLSDFPEVAAAMGGTPASKVRPRDGSRRHSLGSESRDAPWRLFVAVPVRLDGEVVGVISLSRTPRDLLKALYQNAPRLLAGTLLTLWITLAMAVYFGVRVSRSLTRVAVASGRIADGAFDQVAPLGELTRSRITEVGELATSVGVTARRLEDRLGYISEFASHVSHEFRTPLATLKGTLELIEDDVDMPAPQRERLLGNANVELRRLDDLVGGLLALARAEEVTVRESVDLAEVAVAVTDRHGVSCDAEPAIVEGDPRQLDAALDNLVANALKHGGDHVSVRVVVRSLGARALVEVHDDGPGITEGNLERIFDRFFTTDRAAGTGLGLALTATVIRAHGGTVEVRSVPGDTCFDISLPT